MQIAESLDNVLFKNKQSRGGFALPQNQQQAFPQPMELDAMVQRNNAARGPNQKQKQQDMANRTCFYCHQPNHQVRQCPNKQKDAGKAASQ
jgi:putative hemolysin